MKPDKKTFLFGAVVGSGLTAQVADRAGADYLLALNAGRFRVQGASSLTCFLPVRSANDWVFEFSEREFLGRCRAPIFAGLSVSDPGLDMVELVAKVADLGFDGVCNFPSSTLLNGRLAHRMEQEQLGFSRELALIEATRDQGLASFAYVVTNEQARLLAEAGANAICVNIGFTSGGTGVSTNLSLDAAAAQIDRVLEGVPATVRKLCHGGPITSPEDALSIMRKCRVQGFVAGSTLDRLPMEQVMGEVTKDFQAIPGLTKFRQDIEASNEVLVGSSLVIQETRKIISELGKENIPVIIQGETGTGKTVAARLMHENSPFARKKPVIVDCPGLDVPLAGEILLGRALGAGQRGTASASGVFEQADESTIILEEVGALNYETQGQILRFADEGVVQRIGAHDAYQVSARIIATSSVDLRTELENNKFRGDLYYRLSGYEIVLAPLRARVEDIPELALHFARKMRDDESVKFSNSALKLLLEFPWYGNVRELKNAVHRAMRQTDGNQVSAKSLEFLKAQSTDFPGPVNNSPDLSVVQSEKQWIVEALARNGFRRSQTAEELGFTTRTLYNKIKKYNIDIA